MDLTLKSSYGEGYHSGTQIARAMTEGWVADNMYCPIAGILGSFILKTTSP